MKKKQSSSSKSKRKQNINNKFESAAVKPDLMLDIVQHKTVLTKSFSKEPFFIFLALTVILVITSYLPNNLFIGDFKLKPLNLFSDLTKISTPKKAIKKTFKKKKIPVDLSTSQINKNNSKVYQTSSELTLCDSNLIVDYGLDSCNGLNLFLKSLSKAKKGEKKVRIAYFGDSIIEGDIILQDLRNNLQDDYGGSGVGFVPITSVVNNFRQTIRHTFSDDWENVSLLKRSSGVPLGISGYTFIPKTAGHTICDSSDFNESSWVTYQGSKSINNLSHFSGINLFYSHVNDNSYVQLLIDDSIKIIKKLENGEDLKRLTYGDGKSFKKIKLNFLSNAKIYVYGVDFSSVTGVMVDNFSFRGISGSNLLSVNRNHLANLNRYMDYDLVVLQYGTNISSPDNKSYAWYKNSMIPVVNRFKEVFPAASVMIIGVGDMSTKIDGEFQSNPTIETLLKAQEKCAEETKSSFWSLYDAMGGENSMPVFVKKHMANQDYTHLNYYGGKFVANLMSKSIADRFKLFNEQRNMAPKLN